MTHTRARRRTRANERHYLPETRGSWRVLKGTCLLYKDVSLEDRTANAQSTSRWADKTWRTNRRRNGRNYWINNPKLNINGINWRNMRRNQSPINHHHMAPALPISSICIVRNWNVPAPNFHIYVDLEPRSYWQPNWLHRILDNSINYAAWMISRCSAARCSSRNVCVIRWSVWNNFDNSD